MDWVAESASSTALESESATSLRAAQRISCSVQRENARAVLRRSAEGAAEAQDSIAGVAEVIDAMPWQ